MEEAERVKKEAADLINRLKDIVDDLERAAEHGAEGLLLLFGGQFTVDHIKGYMIEVGVYKLINALDYYHAAKN